MRSLQRNILTCNANFLYNPHLPIVSLHVQKLQLPRLRTPQKMEYRPAIPQRVLLIQIQRLLVRRAVKEILHLPLPHNPFHSNSHHKWVMFPILGTASHRCFPRECIPIFRNSYHSSHINLVIISLIKLSILEITLHSTQCRSLPKQELVHRNGTLTMLSHLKCEVTRIRCLISNNRQSNSTITSSRIINPANAGKAPT